MDMLDLLKATIICGLIAFAVYSVPVISQVVIIALLSILWLSYARRTLSSSSCGDNPSWGVIAGRPRRATAMPRHSIARSLTPGSLYLSLSFLPFLANSLWALRIRPRPQAPRQRWRSGLLCQGSKNTTW